MADTITVWVAEHDDDDIRYVINTESDMESNYDDFIDEVYGDTVSIAGFEYSTSRALKEIDPIAYRTGFSDYCDNGWTELSMPLDVYLDNDDTVTRDWIAQHV